MLSRRSSAGVAVLDGMLYVAGGNDGTSCLNSVERFNPKTNTWEGVAAMNIRRLATFTKRTERLWFVCFYIMLHRKRQKEKRWEKNLGWIQGNKLNTPLANWASRMTQFSLYACITSAGSEEYGNSLCGVFLFWFFLALSSFYPYFCASNKHDTLLKGFEKHHRPSLSFTLT